MRRVLAVAALALSLAPSGAASPAPSRAAYLTHVSSVCRSYARKLERVPAPADPAAYGNMIASLRRVVPLLRAQVAAMAALDRPPALAPRLERLFVLDRRSAAALVDAFAAARHRDAGGVATALSRFSSLRHRVHTAAVVLGIRCDPH